VEERARFGEVASQGGPLRELLPEGMPTRRRRRDLDPPHGPQAARGGADRLDLVHALRPRRARPAGDQGDRAGERAVGARPGSWIRVADAGDRAGGGPRVGRLRGPGGDLVAALRRLTSSPATTCRPTGFMRRPCRGRSSSPPVPDAVFEGTLEVAGRSLEISGWPGMIGHNLGHRARRALGLARGNRLRRFRRGPGSTPARPRSGSAVASVPGCRPGCWRSTGSAADSVGWGRSAPPRSTSRPTAASSSCPARTLVVRGRISAPRKDFVGWSTPTRPATEHHTINCSVADLELTVERPRGAGSPADPPGRRCLRVGDAGEGSWNSDPAVRGRLTHRPWNR